MAPGRAIERVEVERRRPSFERRGSHLERRALDWRHPMNRRLLLQQQHQPLPFADRNVFLGPRTWHTPSYHFPGLTNLLTPTKVSLSWHSHIVVLPQEIQSRKRVETANFMESHYRTTKHTSAPAQPLSFFSFTNSLQLAFKLPKIYEAFLARLSAGKEKALELAAKSVETIIKQLKIRTEQAENLEKIRLQERKAKAAAFKMEQVKEEKRQVKLAEQKQRTRKRIIHKLQQLETVRQSLLEALEVIKSLNPLQAQTGPLIELLEDTNRKIALLTQQLEKLSLGNHLISRQSSAEGLDQLSLN